MELVRADGTRSIADSRSTVEQGGVFTPLADPTFFARVIYPGEAFNRNRNRSRDGDDALASTR